MIKAIRIFLLVLIIIGFSLIFTQKIWVPKVVDFILSDEYVPVPVVVPVVQKNISLVDGRQCYTYSREATPDAPYTVSEFIDLTITGREVQGTKKGTQSGPDMTNGYEGTLVGSVDKDMMTVTFAYTVEGSKNKEKEIYRAGKTGIEKMRYPLLEGKGILIPDTTKEFSIINYARVGCEGSN